MRFLLIAALLLQGLVFVPRPGAAWSDSVAHACGCDVSGKASCCCAPVDAAPEGPTGGPTTAPSGCNASLGSSLCSCPSAPVVPTPPPAVPQNPDPASERSLAGDVQAVFAGSSPCTEGGHGYLLSASPLAPPDPHRMRAVLCVWRN